MLLEEDVAGAARPVLREVPVPAAVDGWVVAVHEPGASAKPGIHRPAWAIANPVLIDGDGDGGWAPTP